jgi:hypothetical protein
MSNLPPPKSVQLTPPGPYVLPTAEVFSNLVFAQGQLPVQIRFLGPGGLELHLPATEHFLEKLYTNLKVHFEEGGGAVC